LLIFGEVTPKIFSRNNPEKFTMYSLPVLSKLSAVVRMTVIPIKKFIKTIFPDVGLAPVRRLTSLSLEEIHELISQANSSGVIGKETSQMLERVLKISETSVSKIMTPVENFEAVNLENSEEKVLDLIIETGRSRVPVYRKNAASIQGFVHTKDLLWAWKNKEGRFSEDLIRAPYFVPYDKKIYELMKEFQSGKTHIAFVNDALGNVIGLVTLEDVLEEIVGEILDEYDLEEGETGS
jgi:CBS domain containing-hemolysin-like protein